MLSVVGGDAGTPPDPPGAGGDGSPERPPPDEEDDDEQPAPCLVQPPQRRPYFLLLQGYGPQVSTAMGRGDPQPGLPGNFTLPHNPACPIPHPAP